MESSPTVINQPQESPNPTGSNNNTTGQAHVGVGGDPNQQQQQQQPHQEYNEDANHPRFRSGHNPFFVRILLPFLLLFLTFQLIRHRGMRDSLEDVRMKTLAEEETENLLRED